MRKIVSLLLVSTTLITATACAQGDKSQRPSPPAKATATLKSGTAVTIDYSQPAVKGRTIGKEIAPYGEVWRTGANEATTIELSKDVQVEGQALKAGKYALFTIPTENEWTVIFNSVPVQWGAYDHDPKKDVLRVKVKPSKSDAFAERMTFKIDPSGKIDLTWGNVLVPISIQ